MPHLIRGCPLLAVVVLTTPVWSQSGEKYALLVGVQRYGQNSGLNQLRFAENDVEELSKELLQHGYRTENVTVLTMTRAQQVDARYIPTRQNIAEQLGMLVDGLRAPDSLLVVLVGHGVQFEGDDASYFCPVDARLSGRQNLLSLETDVFEKLKRCAASRKLVLYDACRDNPFVKDGRAPASATRPVPKPPPGGTAILYACSPGEQSYENSELQHGVFSHYVMEALRGTGDLNKDGEVGLLELSSHVGNRVYHFVRVKYGTRQTPKIYGDVAEYPLVEIMPKLITNSIGMKLVLIPSGEFQMGSHESGEEVARLAKQYGYDSAKAEDYADEHPQHRVQLSRPFYLGIHEVTVGQFRAFVKATDYKTEAESDGKGGWVRNWSEAGKWEQKPEYVWHQPGFTQGDDLPVVQVSWNDAVAFCKWLSGKEGVEYRLPTEAEWEYACRSGTSGRYSIGEDPEGLLSIANVADTGAGWAAGVHGSDGYEYTAPVGHYRPNAFGLYDMHGNVYEWCSDWYSAEYYASSTVLDPKGPSSGESRVCRGGSWGSGPNYVRSADRDRSAPDSRLCGIGFRVARTYH